MFQCAKCLAHTTAYSTTYASSLVFSGDDMSDTIQRIHETAAKKATGNLMSYCIKCSVVTANVDDVECGTDKLVTWHTRIKHRIEYDTFAARMPSKRALGKRKHFVSNLKSKARKNNVARVTSVHTEDEIGNISCEYTRTPPRSYAKRVQYVNCHDCKVHAAVFEFYVNNFAESDTKHFTQSTTTIHLCIDELIVLYPVDVSFSNPDRHLCVCITVGSTTET